VWATQAPGTIEGIQWPRQELRKKMKQKAALMHPCTTLLADDTTRELVDLAPSTMDQTALTLTSFNAIRFFEGETDDLFRPHDCNYITSI